MATVPARRGYVTMRGRWAKPKKVPRYRDDGPIQDERAAQEIYLAAGAVVRDLDASGAFLGGFHYRGLSAVAQSLLLVWVMDGDMPLEWVLEACRGERPMPAWASLPDWGISLRGPPQPQDAGSP